MKKAFAFVAAFAAIAFVSCNKGNDNNGGDNTASKEVKVAEDALVAYFPLDDATEKVANLPLDGQGAGTEANFVTGRRGKAYQGSKDSYLRYNLPTDSPLRNLKAMSISMWLKHAEIDYDHAPVPQVFQITQSDDRCWGNFAISCDRTAKGAGWLTWKVQWKIGDKGNLWKTTNGSYEDEDTGETVFPWANVFPAARWNHIIWCYDNKTSQFHCYVNGVDVTPESFVDCLVGEPAEAIGDLTFVNAEQIMIGNWDVKYTSAEGWGWGDEWIGGFEEGQVDEIRVFSRALTAEEAKALYDAEVNAMD